MLTDDEYKAIQEKLTELEILAVNIKDQSHAGKLLHQEIHKIKQMIFFWTED